MANNILIILVVINIITILVARTIIIILVAINIIVAVLANHTIPFDLDHLQKSYVYCLFHNVCLPLYGLVLMTPN